MKYANVMVGLLPASKEKSLFNIGDYMTFRGIENLYRFMGIHENEKVYIELDELKSYDGDYAVLPINLIMAPGLFLENNKFCISPKLLPVFLGASLEEGKWTNVEGLYAFLRNHEPVGCRDDVTLTVMREHGIKAYLGGCLSLAIPRRDERIKGDTVFLVDIPKKLVDYIPNDIKKNAVVVSHYRYLKESERSRENCVKLAQQQYLEYEQKAKLVVTSRLHAALPCLAMGIPVILVRDYGAYTFSWIEKLTPFYTRKDYDKIDWNPKPVELEEFKRKLLLNASTRLRNEFEKNKAWCEISEFYENRQPRLIHYEECQNIYLGDLFEKLSRNWNKNEHIRYALWGIQSNTEEIYQYIRKNFPKAELVKVFDSWHNYVFHGIQTSHPREMTADDDYYTIVIATNAVHAAQSLFKEIQKPQEQYYFVADTFLEGGAPL